MKSSEVVSKLMSAGFQAESVEVNRVGYHVKVTLASEQVRPFALWLLAEGFFIDFVSAVDVAPAIQVIYQFAHYDNPCRVNARVSLPESGAIDTISDIYQGSDWHERETRDFFGIVFTGHHHLEPLILCEEDKDLKPLLKKESARKTLEEVGWPDPFAEKAGMAVKADEGDLIN